MKAADAVMIAVLAGCSAESSRANTPSGPSCPTWAVVDSDAVQAAPARPRRLGQESLSAATQRTQRCNEKCHLASECGEIGEKMLQSADCSDAWSFEPRPHAARSHAVLLPRLWILWVSGNRAGSWADFTADLCGAS